jgi:hypothetical protein
MSAAFHSAFTGAVADTTTPSIIRTNSVSDGGVLVNTATAQFNKRTNPTLSW